MCPGGQHASKSRGLQTLTLTFLVLYRSNLSPEMISLSAPAPLKALIEVPYQTSILRYCCIHCSLLSLSVLNDAHTHTCPAHTHKNAQPEALVLSLKIWAGAPPCLVFISAPSPLWLSKPSRNKTISHKTP